MSGIIQKTFIKWKSGWLIGLVSGLSLFIFLVVIGFNYRAIGGVQQLNDELHSGPLALKETWYEIALSMNRAEAARQNFLLTKDPKVAATIAPLVVEIREQLRSLPATTRATLSEAVNRYGDTFAAMAQAMATGLTARAQLVTDRENVELIVYDLEAPDLEEALGEYQVAELTYLMNGNEESADSVRVMLDRFDRDAAGKELEKDFRAAVATYRATFAKLIDNHQRVETNSKAMETQATEFAQLVRAGVRSASKQADAAAEAARNQANSAQNSALVWTAIGVVLAVSLLWLYQRLFNRQVVTTLDGLSKLAEGDLNFRFPRRPHSKNELCRIMQGANAMADNLEALLSLIVDKVSHIQKAASQIAELRQGLSQAAKDGAQMVREVGDTLSEVDANTRTVFQLVEKNQQQAVASEGAAQAFQQIITAMSDASEHAGGIVSGMMEAANAMPDSMLNVNSNLAQVNHAMREVSQSVGDLNQSQQSVRAMCQRASSESDTARSHVASATDATGSLLRATGEITNVVHLINEIAEQTNMLALNASIEAAGAGESGKGFAVVANEVKALARQTAEATDAIADNIDRMQGMTRQVERSMAQVRDGMDNVATANHDITDAMNTQAHAIEQIMQSLRAVNTATDSVTQTAQELEGAAKTLANSAQQANEGAQEIVGTAQSAVSEAHGVAENATAMREQSGVMRERTEDFFTSSDQVKSLSGCMIERMESLDQMSGAVGDLSHLLRDDAAALREAAARFRFSSASAAVDATTQ
ncbi:methyl-accepting chemotaxis protein [Magnetofaba australis]|uniref:Putative methyl-accepting chemotaxis sensory transducer n=1 Tax=Magnetofaba australis IT-1 TaxID=1434232 RepID=A0A1Y2K8Y8_9PROT|nr:methyl-accepting chemotaxis protein [Magnetofaba australis]OSM07193.1 putative methyl-accepting chemotaxis sensory transducer [Magnetofaba australis IT-1]